MTTCWIVVADACKANVYTSEKAHLLRGEGKLQLVHQQEHPEGREKKHNLVSDRMGHHKSKGGTDGDFVPHTDPKEHELDKFALEVARFLDAKRIDNAYQEIVLVAPSRIHGLINKHLNQHVKALVRVNVEKDYIHLSPKELEIHLSPFL